MTATKITGASKGPGFAAAHTAYLGAHDREYGAAADKRLGATSVQLDVTDEASVTAAAAWLARPPGGIAGPAGTFQAAAGRVR